MSKSWFKRKGKNPHPKYSGGTTISQSNTSTASTGGGWEKTRDIAIPFLEFVANISEASDVLAPLKAACSATKKVLETIRNNKEDWSHLSQRLQGHLESMEDQITVFEGYPEESRKADDSLRQPLLAYVRKLEEMQNAVEGRTRSRLLSRATKVDIDAGDIQKFHKDIDDCHQRLTAALAVTSALHIQVIKGDTEALKEDAQTIKKGTKALLNDVDVVAIFQLPVILSTSSTVHDCCKPGTRVAVLDNIRHWGEGEFSEPIFWLCDIAGSGKSTVSTSMVAVWKDAGMLAGQFFFSINSMEESAITKLCPTFARQMYENVPALAPYAVDAVKRHPAIMTRPFEEQFQKLIVDPIKHHGKPVIIVIDALDECRLIKERQRLLEAVSAASQTTPHLKFFLTSRPDPDIEKLLGPLTLKKKLEFRLHDRSFQDNVDDVATYIHETLKDVLSHEQRLNLIKKANGLFIWAKTVCQMFDPERRFEPPDVVYEKITSREYSSDIDSVYQLVLERIEPLDARQAATKMLGVLVTAFESLTLVGLSKILEEMGQRVDADNLTKRLGSVLHVEPVTTLVRFRHQTFLEYLKRRSSSGDSINMTESHTALTQWSLKIMKRELKFNICQIESSFIPNAAIGDFESRVSRFISPELRYASSHWLFHLSEMDDRSREMELKQVQYAVQSPQVLYWVEVMGAVLGVPRAITGLRRVASYFKVRFYLFFASAKKPNQQGDIHDRMADIKRFLMAFSTPIQDSLPHIYISALSFTPLDSTLRKESQKWFPNILSVTQGLDEGYPGLPHELIGHEEEISAISLSPDGLRIISGSMDRTIRQWDLETGQMLGKPLRGHTDAVICVAVSPDGFLIASGSNDATIRLWDVETGNAIGEPLNGHTYPVLSVLFSPDSQHIYSGSVDDTIRLWDVEGREALGQPLEGHEKAVTCLANFPDGLRLVSGSADRTLRIWDLKTLQPVGQSMEGHDNVVTSVSVLPDSLQILSASLDGTIRCWDSMTGDQLQEWRMPLMGRALRLDIRVDTAFSPDGTRAISFGRKFLVLWDKSAEEVLGLETISITAAAFSEPHNAVVTGSGRGIILLWNTDDLNPVGKAPQGHTSSVRSVAVSNDGSKIASCSFDGNIYLWDAKTGKEYGVPLEGHIGDVSSVVFSGDDSLVASGGEDSTVRVWNVATHQMSGDPFTDHTTRVESLTFSHYGHCVASGSRDGSIYLWDVGTVQVVGKLLQTHNDGIASLHFSPDDSSIVSASWDGMICLWRASTGEMINRVEYTTGLHSVAMSLDGLQLAVIPGAGPVSVLDATTGKEVKKLVDHLSNFWASALSSNWQLLVSGLSNGVVQLWDTESQRWKAFLRGHTDGVTALTLFPDGSRVVSGSQDATIRVWDSSFDMGQAKIEEVEPEDIAEPSSSHERRLPFSISDLRNLMLSEDGWVMSNDQLVFWSGSLFSLSLRELGQNGTICWKNLSTPPEGILSIIAVDPVQDILAVEAGSWSDIRLLFLSLSTLELIPSDIDINPNDHHICSVYSNLCYIGEQGDEEFRLCIKDWRTGETILDEVEYNQFCDPIILSSEYFLVGTTDPSSTAIVIRGFDDDRAVTLQLPECVADVVPVSSTWISSRSSRPHKMLVSSTAYDVVLLSIRLQMSVEDYDEWDFNLVIKSKALSHFFTNYSGCQLSWEQWGPQSARLLPITEPDTVSPLSVHGSRVLLSMSPVVLASLYGEEAFGHPQKCSNERQIVLLDFNPGAASIPCGHREPGLIRTMDTTLFEPAMLRPSEVSDGLLFTVLNSRPATLKMGRFHLTDNVLIEEDAGECTMYWMGDP
ncbi:hypothetical protein PIIN_05395 [Serendipita indica DSM 11827]|uniref:Nephrocystin 3-like N-terminal domain-containing protein n=1 Tax=Serendipita indica (strain DSM 11827) TaxID=1109443 RepID=G4TJG9_SERID|nr:hypothetical protein PIIN_05395 [Serendipita indica DSM 11827]